MNTKVLNLLNEYKKIYNDAYSGEHNNIVIPQQAFEPNKNMKTLTYKISSINIQDIIENISSDLPKDGFIKDTHYSFHNRKIYSRCDILNDWIKCYKEEDKTITSKKWKYIEKNDNIFINDKICTILIDNS